MELKFTEYWAWYRQRLRRCWHNEILLSAPHVKHVDRMADFHESMKYISVLVNPRTCAIGAHMITHLPHHVDGIWPQGINDKGHKVRSPQLDSMQETWCELQFGLRDREWLYLGNASWAFRLNDQAVQFELTW
jgi:hypothetical protein